MLIKREVTRFQAVQAQYGRYWAVGDRGAIFSSTDGKLWARYKQFTERNLFGITFRDPALGVVVGEGGLIATTEDNGEHWSTVKTGVVEDLRGVSFGSRNVGCAVGLRGIILVTHDEGKTWIRKDVGLGESFFAVTMTSPSEAWVVGERGMILHTVDSGRTWTSERHSSGRWLYSVWFGGDAGWAVGQGGMVLRRMMGKWDEIPLPAGADTLFAITGLGRQSVIVAGAGGQAWNTTDVGMSWQRREMGTKEPVTGIVMAGDTGWAVGMENAMYSTIDAGASWANYALESLPSFTAAAFTDAAAGWVVGRRGLIWMTRDGGKTWGQQEAGVRRDLVAVKALSRALCFASGEGVIVKTDDGGNTWRRVYQEPPPTPEELEKPKNERRRSVTFSDVFFFDERRGWAVGTDGWIMYSGSAGEYWDRLSTGVDRALNSVWFVSPSRGFLACDDGQIYATDNGGKRWVVRAAAGGGEPLRSLFFLDEAYGWAVGDGGTIMRTRDGGASWKEMRLGGAISLRGVCFVDRITGWLAGERGTLMKTWDGGDTWVNDRSPVTSDFSGIQFISPELGWAVGDRGVILEYRGNRPGA
jgi:photosystem II stability/assembly factor-like uncharacterized protein